MRRDIRHVASDVGRVALSKCRQLPATSRANPGGEKQQRGACEQDNRHRCVPTRAWAGPEYWIRFGPARVLAVMMRARGPRTRNVNRSSSDMSASRAVPRTQRALHRSCAGPSSAPFTTQATRIVTGFRLERAPALASHQGLQQGRRVEHRLELGRRCSARTDAHARL